MQCNGMKCRDEHGMQDEEIEDDDDFVVSEEEEEEEVEEGRRHGSTARQVKRSQSVASQRMAYLSAYLLLSFRLRASLSNRHHVL